MSEHPLYSQGVRPPKSETAAAPPTREDKIKARVTSLLDSNTRRQLEEMARFLGFEPSKTEYPNMETLAKAIAEKEFPPEVETEEP